MIAGPAEWRIRCQTCMYAKPFGTARLNAEIAASRHRMSKPDHTVWLYDGHKKIREFAGCDQTVISMSSVSDQNTPF